MDLHSLLRSHLGDKSGLRLHRSPIKAIELSGLVHTRVVTSYLQRAAWARRDHMHGDRINTILLPEHTPSRELVIRDSVRLLLAKPWYRHSWKL